MKSYSSSKSFSLRKSRNLLKSLYKWYKKKGHYLPASRKTYLEEEMKALDQAILLQEKEKASQIAQQLEQFASTHCKKNVFEYAWELIIALIVALVIATLVRQMWFELYEIPTGSMRPTFREQDHLTVTKTAFGINFPLRTSHLLFNPELVQRTSILIFSGDGLPLPDTDTTYFGIFPYKKRYIKRCIGKPGDSLYFYGGRLFGIDQNGKEITELQNTPWMNSLEYIPFLTFEGEVSPGESNRVLFSQMHYPLGRIPFSSSGPLPGEVFNGKKWVKDQPLAQTKSHSTIETYSDWYGMRNYAIARLLTKEEIDLTSETTEGLEEGLLYLQLRHTPSLAYPKLIVQREIGGTSIGIPAYSTLIPLKQSHLDALMANLYTARFVVSDGKASRYSQGEKRIGLSSPSFPNVPDGTYEFYSGKATKIHWGGITSEVPADSPLYSHDPLNVQKLFNLGIEMSLAYAPHSPTQTLFPHRYAYFRDGELFLMGAPVFKKEDPLLISFNKREEERQRKASMQKPYVAFKDYGPPLKEGTIDKEFIKTFGITVPQNHYLVLGDNHAMSADSRIFGFVPQNNLQGAPCWIIWPPGDRLGSPPQKPYPLFNLPRTIIWSIVALIALCWYLYHRRSLKRPVLNP